MHECRLKYSQYGIGVWKCPRSLPPDPSPNSDIGLGFGTRIESITRPSPRTGYESASHMNEIFETIPVVEPLLAPYCAVARDYLSDTPLLRTVGFLVSQHGQFGAIPLPLF